MALLPSLMVLLGSMILLGLHWSSLGLVVAAGAAIYVPIIVLLSTRYIAPAARVSNAWDTRIGGTLADFHLLQRGGEIVRRRGARRRPAGPRHRPLAKTRAANLAAL
jgi:hypothetical protein